MGRKKKSRASNEKKERNEKMKLRKRHSAAPSTSRSNMEPGTSFYGKEEVELTIWMDEFESYTQPLYVDLTTGPDEDEDEVYCLGGVNIKTESKSDSEEDWIKPSLEIRVKHEFTCKICRLHFSAEPDLQMHISSEHVPTTDITIREHLLQTSHMEPLSNNYIVNSLSQLELPKPILVLKNDFICTYCNKVCTNNEEIRLHIEAEHVKDSENTPKNNSRTISARNRRKSLREHFNTTNLSYSLDEDNPQKNEFLVLGTESRRTGTLCKNCGLKVRNIKELEKHLEREHKTIKKEEEEEDFETEQKPIKIEKEENFEREENSIKKVEEETASSELATTRRRSTREKVGATSPGAPQSEKHSKDFQFSEKREDSNDPIDETSRKRRKSLTEESNVTSPPRQVDSPSPGATSLATPRSGKNVQSSGKGEDSNDAVNETSRKRRRSLREENKVTSPPLQVDSPSTDAPQSGKHSKDFQSPGKSEERNSPVNETSRKRRRSLREESKVTSPPLQVDSPSTGAPQSGKHLKDFQSPGKSEDSNSPVNETSRKRRRSLREESKVTSLSRQVNSPSNLSTKELKSEETEMHVNSEEEPETVDTPQDIENTIDSRKKRRILREHVKAASILDNSNLARNEFRPDLIGSKFICTYCKRRFRNEKEVKKHLEREHVTNSVHSSEEDLISPGRLRSLRVRIKNNTVTYDTDEDDSHKKKLLDNNQVDFCSCFSCGKQVGSKDDLLNHIHQEHSPDLENNTPSRSLRLDKSSVSTQRQASPGVTSPSTNGPHKGSNDLLNRTYLQHDPHLGNNTLRSLRSRRTSESPQKEISKTSDTTAKEQVENKDVLSNQIQEELNPDLENNSSLQSLKARAVSTAKELTKTNVAPQNKNKQIQNKEDLLNNAHQEQNLDLENDMSARSLRARRSSVSDKEMCKTGNTSVSTNNKLTDTSVTSTQKKKRYSCELCEFSASSSKIMKNHILRKHSRKTKEDVSQDDTSSEDETAEEIYREVSEKKNEVFTDDNDEVGSGTEDDKRVTTDAEENKRVSTDVEENNQAPAELISQAGGGKIKCFLTCITCGFACEPQHVMHSHILEVHSSWTLYKCRHCCYDSPTMSLLRKHTIFKHPQEPNRLCCYCEYAGTAVKDLRKHLANNHPDEKKFMCVVCEFGTRSANRLKSHVFHEHPFVKPPSCDKCRFTTVKLRYLNRHILSAHKTSSDFLCILCNLTCSTYLEFKNHIKRYHPAEI